MEYQGYQTKEELIILVEKNFPYIPRPSDREFFAFDEFDLMGRIIERNISEYTGEVLPYEGVFELYDEFNSITDKAVQWFFPSLLRVLIRGEDRSGNLPHCLVSYFENYMTEVGSAYNFSWLSSAQVSTLICLMEYLSEEYGEVVALAQENLCTINQP